MTRQAVRVVWQVTREDVDVDRMIASFPFGADNGEQDAIAFSRASNAAVGKRTAFSVLRSLSVGGKVAI